MLLFKHIKLTSIYKVQQKEKERKGWKFIFPFDFKNATPQKKKKVIRMVTNFTSLLMN